MMKTQSHPGAVQLELGLPGREPGSAPPPCGKKLARAQWWFDQMHRAVQHALDWRAAPPARSEQIWLPPLPSGTASAGAR